MAPHHTTTKIWKADALAVKKAAETIASGGLFALPTETVYGLAADATNSEAVARIYETKGRPRFNPLIVHGLDADHLAHIAEFDDCSLRLLEKFWPGPLTLVLPVKPGAPIAHLVTAGLSTVAVRAPRHTVARAVLESLDRPFVAPSANKSGKISPTTAQHVADEFAGSVPVLDGGPCTLGLESTIISLVGPQPTLLRPGSISAQDIETALGHRLQKPGEAVQAPGMMPSHYAPAASIRLNAIGCEANEVLLGFDGTPGATLDLSPSGDLIEAAANLFGYLRQLDAANRPIAVAPIPNDGIGTAINDRLSRAAAPR